MSLFGGTTTYVSSVLYNLAGPEEDRIDYLKSAVAGNILLNSQSSISDTIAGSMLKGPAMKMRSFYNWAVDNYAYIGMPAGNIGTGNLIADYNAISGAIPHATDETVHIDYAWAGSPDFTWWALQYMEENHPDLLTTDPWISSLDKTTNTITITFGDSTTESFIPSNYETGATYIYAYYYIVNTSGFALPSKMFIYKMGSGNASLDALHAITSVDEDGYFPFIPVRIENEFLSDTYNPDAYNLAKKALKKAMGKKFDDLVADLKENDSLDDIDYAYVVFGVPLNAKDNSAKKYLYKFFDKIRANQDWLDGDFQDYLDGLSEHSAATRQYAFWLDAQQEPGNPDYGTPPPPVPGQPTGPLNVVQIKDSGTFTSHLNMTITWMYIKKTSGTGLAKADAKNGDLWTVREGTPYASGISVKVGTDVYNDTSQYTDTTFTIYWQTSSDSWEALTIYGAYHTNNIYGNNSVIIKAGDAIDDTDESGFIVPIHYGLMRELSLRDQNQMQCASAFMVFNCYERVKQKWYQTGIFKIILFAVIIALTIAFPPFGSAGLGIYASIGAAIGLSGIMAVVAGIIISQIAAILMMKIFQTVGTEIFGEKFGAIFAAVATVVAMAVAQGLMAGQSMSTIWGGLTSSSNIINMTSAVGKGVSGYVQAATNETIAETQKLNDEYNKEAAELDKLYEQNIGYGTFGFDPMDLTNFYWESEDSFLSRTLLTGGDIAEFTMDMVTNFTDYTLILR